MPRVANRLNTSRYRFRLRARILRAGILCAGILRAGILACSGFSGVALLSAGSAAAAPVVEAADASAGSARAWTKAYAHGQWSLAIELLEAIPESSRTAWHWLHLARSLERHSRLVEAFAAYERVHDLSAAAGSLNGSRDAQRQAKLESSALSSRIPWAEVSLAGALPLGALIFIDQQWLEPTRLRSPYPVNPGWHTFLLESNGEVLAARRAFFEEGQTRLVPLTVLDANGSMPAVSLPTEGTASGSEATRQRTLTWRPEARQRPEADQEAGSLLKATYVSLGVGGLGTLVGTGFLISALNMRTGGSDRPNCLSDRCDADAVVDADRANRRWRAQAGAATASYAIGLAGLITGGVLWLLHRDSAARATTVHIADLSLELAPRFSPHGAMLRGTF